MRDPPELHGCKAAGLHEEATLLFTVPRRQKLRATHAHLRDAAAAFLFPAGLSSVAPLLAFSPRCTGDSGFIYNRPVQIGQHPILDLIPFRHIVITFPSLLIRHHHRFITLRNKNNIFPYSHRFTPPLRPTRTSDIPAQVSFHRRSSFTQKMQAILIY